MKNNNLSLASQSDISLNRFHNISIPSMAILQCSVCELHNQKEAKESWEIHRNDLWILRHHPEPAPLTGWLLLDSKRHTEGPVDFTSKEAQNWGLIVQKASSLIKSLTNCQRVYTIAFGEGARHLHLHLIPRFEQEAATQSWAIADFYREVMNGSRKPANPNKIASIVKEARSLWS